MPTRPFFDLVVDNRTYRVEQLAPPRVAGDVTWLVSLAGRYVCSVRYGSSLLLTREQLEAALAAEVRRAQFATPGSDPESATSR
ncbi:MAG TPA: hypothetical protein VLE53_08270 [Gemmatimonadaceae bacterium]|nr:hypothetical protein [Gemmatimonadaceae bacterium]